MPEAGITSYHDGILYIECESLDNYTIVIAAHDIICYVVALISALILL